MLQTQLRENMPRKEKAALSALRLEAKERKNTLHRIFFLSLCSLIFALILMRAASAHVGEHPSIHDTMASLTERLRSTLPQEDLLRLNSEKATALLTEEERHVLGNAYWSFEVNAPVQLWVLHPSNTAAPFWLKEEGYEKTSQSVGVGEQRFEAWRRDCPAGPVGLGINGFQANSPHYFLILTPQEKGTQIKLSQMYPGRHRVGPIKKGAAIYVDSFEERVSDFSETFEDGVIVRAIGSRIKDTQLEDVFRYTSYPATAQPDQIVLTWTTDPQTSQTIQWRTDTTVQDGWVALERAGEERLLQAASTILEDPNLANNAVNHRYTVTIDDLEAGTTYRYRVGSKETETWSAWADFKTAPAQAESFSFIYMGDAQNGLDTWGELVHKAFERKPEAAFYIMAGDLVNRGNDRGNWDSLFHNASGIFDRRQLAPAIGNHECQGGEPRMYLDLFTLPENGPDDIEAERVYSFRYSNALFVVLDTNLPVNKQSKWLEKQLAETDATWKFVVYHHPAFSSAPERDNKSIRKRFGSLFDKYHVDMALQGHDHAYLRTYPMYDEKRQESPKDGTVYVVSVSGTKFYESGEYDYAAHAMTNVSTYQVLDIKIEGNRLSYRAYDLQGELRDELIIEK